MSIFDKVYNTLVVEGNELTAKQMADFFGTTPATIVARIADLRNSGNAVYANRKTNSKGVTRTFYRVGTPTKAVVAAGYKALRQARAVA